MEKDGANTFRVLIAFQGPYGERFHRHISSRSPPGWKVISLRLPPRLPFVVDEPSDFLPASVPEADLAVFVHETPQAGQLVVDVVKRSGAKAAIVPIDNNSWMPKGLANQISRQLGALSVPAAFPKPFCSLAEQGQPQIDEFARHFGKPALRIRCSDKLDAIEVLRGAPCGSTDHMAKNCVGIPVLDAREKCALASHHYPCLASMEMDPDLDDTIMHSSGFLVMQEVERAIIEHLGKKPWAGSYLIPK